MPTLAKPRPGTQAAKLLAVAAAELASPDGFTLEELVVAAWRSDPATWGLRGFEDQYPDSKVVALAFYSACRHFCDLIEAPGNGRYRLTPAGAKAA